MVDEEEKKRIAVIGSEEFTLGFRLAGIQKTFGKENYRQKLQDLLERDDLGIVIVQETDLHDLPNRIRRQVDESVDPVVVSLSEEAESERLNEKIRKVIGADIT
ncbi:MAG: V-type ATP synthase subunit F [Candidatus Nanohaloarchaea archaeon]